MTLNPQPLRAEADSPGGAERGEPIELRHQKRLAPLLAASGSAFSEYTFANLYLFRHRHRYRFVDGARPFLLGRTYDGETHALPLRPLDVIAASELLRYASCVYPVGEEGPNLALAAGLECSWNPDDSDYVYDAERLARLDGAKAKRQQARRFAEAYDPIWATIDANNLHLARAVVDGWFEDAAKAEDDTDLAACLEALDLQARLGLRGRIVLDRDGVPVAFLLASLGPMGSMIIHFAKGRRSHAGAYPWMFARVAKERAGGLLNFEQDLGNPRFAQAKRALNPIGRLAKHRLRLPRWAKALD